MKKKKFNVGDVYEWKGVRNSDCNGLIDSGWLSFVIEVNEDGSVRQSIGKKIEGAKNRWEAIRIAEELDLSNKILERYCD